jgi:signal transduction histidine kinase/ligand-binding sensor domain-containing protein
MSLKRISIPLVWLFLPVLTLAQGYTTINYSVSEGLPSNEVYEVFQDRHGFLWFATDNGVVKYDGYEMVRFGVEDGLTDPVVFGFHEDKKGRIWFRTFSGKLSYFENNRIYVYPHNNKLTEVTRQSIISSIYVDDDDQLWFSTFRNKGTWGVIDSNGSMTSAHPSGSIYRKKVGDGVLLGYVQEPTTSIQIDDQVFPIGAILQCDVFNVLAVEWRGRIYVSACNNIYEFDGQGLQKIHEAKYPIISLSTDAEENLWVGYMSKGVDKFSSRDFKPAATPEILRQLSVSKVFQDNHDGLWFSTLEKGLFHIPDVHIINYEMPADAKIRFVSTGTNEMFVGTSNGEVMKAGEGKGLVKMYSFPPPLKGLYVDKTEKIWVTSANHTDIIDLSNKTKTNYYYSLTNATEDKNGNLYTVSGGAMLVIISADRKSVEEKKLPFMCRNVFVQDTTMFIGTRSGLYVSGLSATNPRTIPSLADFKINRILKLSDSTLLLTTIGRGFLVFNTRNYSFVNYNRNHQFIANNIYAAILDDDNIWLGTESGLVRMKLTQDFPKKIEYLFLTKQDGLISTQVTHLACKEGLIWVFSDNGYSILDKRTDLGLIMPRYYLKNIKINNRELDDLSEDISLSFEENNIEINFGFIALNKPKIFFRHRLGKNEPWNFSETKSLQYFALAPGRYEIEVEYSVDNINWYEGLVSPKLSISPPLWKTWYFFVGLAGVIAVFIVLFFRYQLMVYRRHQLKLIESEIQTIERERTRIAKDLHDSVGTDFSAIKMMVSQLLKKHQEPEAEEIESQFQNSIQEIKSIIYDLSPPGLERYGLMTGLRNYTDKINGKVPAKITISTFGNEVKEPALSVSAFRILQELISNSLKHSNAKNISIHLNAFDDLLNMVYEDDGKGFSLSDSRRGAGLFNIESRVQSLNGRLKFESSTYGVSYTIDIPVQKAIPIQK